VKKRVILTSTAQEFFDGLEERAQKEFARTRRILATEGYLHAPYAEKVVGYSGLFAIRVTQGQNVRFFYCYDTGECVFVLSGYEKKTMHIPVREIWRALKIKKELGL